MDAFLTKQASGGEPSFAVVDVFLTKQAANGRPAFAIVDAMKKRVHVYYSGSVQGVGFRFTAERIALNIGLCGWVRNLWDGRVEVVCEGEESELVDFLNKMKNGPLKPYIRGAEVNWQKAAGEFTDFTIKF